MATDGRDPQSRTCRDKTACERSSHAAQLIGSFARVDCFQRAVLVKRKPRHTRASWSKHGALDHVDSPRRAAEHINQIHDA